MERKTSMSALVQKAKSKKTDKNKDQHQKKPKNYVLVTVGTTKFEELIQVVDTREFGEVVTALGYHTLKIQYGPTSTYEPHVLAKLSALPISFMSPKPPSVTAKVKNGTVSASEGTGSGSGVVREDAGEVVGEGDGERQGGVEGELGLSRRLTVESFRITEKFTDVMQNASLVIAHAGAGTIMEGLSLHKHMIVVANPTLADNHQFELARAMAKQRYVIQATPATLLDQLRSTDDSDVVPYPPATLKPFVDYINDAVGLC
eukprot:TRINITY_DN15_c2_g1_i1.p1 TRINITY_DN15_c2_g1~~TRINITY_DN15_c2_g1_i1.p1  ORF type:complete len:260 (-),score=41.37 TRINITY_DN15_c2_g1_i1:158-937(-)